MGKTKDRPTDAQILKQAKWNNDTAYTGQITYEFPDGYKVHAVYIEGNNTRTSAEHDLVVAVLEHMGYTVD